MIDFAPKLAKVAAKLAEVGPSWPKVGLKVAQRCRQDGPKPVKSVATDNGNPPGSHQGATKEPPGTTLSDPMPPGMPSNQIKDERTKHRHGPGKGTRDRTRDKGQGTRDDERI